MTNLINKVCEHLDCNNFVYEEDKIGFGSYCCFEHIGKCLLCKRSAIYNIKCEYPKYCSHHKSNEMINVISKRCEYSDCNKIAVCGDKYNPKYCSKHRTDDMSYSYNNCCYPLCKNIAYYVDSNSKVNKRTTRYCSSHKTDEMINTSIVYCLTPYCRTSGNPKYEGYCLACFVNNPENQNKPAMRNYKTKEKEVVDKITQTFMNFTWVCDKKVQDGCSRRRPDLLLDMGSHIIIVEIDENKHTDYDCSCENKRLMELSQDLQHRPIVFIRFNPDDYTNQEGELVKSCWKLNKLGVIQIIKTKKKEWEDRIESLKQQIQYWIDNPTEKTIEIIELFY